MFHEGCSLIKEDKKVKYDKKSLLLLGKMQIEDKRFY